MPKRRYFNTDFSHVNASGGNKSEIDRMANTRAYDEAVTEFLMACCDAREQMGGRPLSLSQAFQVMLALGYRKV